jgi:hypothetical protein
MTVRRCTMCKYLAILASAVCLHASLAGGGVIVGYSTGIVFDVIFGNPPIAPAIAPPGTPFVLDYTPWLGSQSALYQPVGFLMGFQCQTPYSTLNIRLDSAPTVYEFPPTFPADSGTVAWLYDPAFMSGSGMVPAYVMPDDWKNELADGRLEARFWVEGTPFPPQFAVVQGEACYLIVPEPVSLLALAAGATCLLARRRTRAR